MPANAKAHGSEPRPDRPDVPTNVAWTTPSGCVEQAAQIRRPCHERPSGASFTSWLSIPSTRISGSSPMSSATTAISLGVGTWQVGWSPGGNASKRVRLSRYTRYIVWCAWRRAAASLLCRLASNSHRCAVCTAIGGRYREKSQSSNCMPQKAQVSKTLERLKIGSRWCRLEAIKPDV
jgi:hypothetical protein